MDKKKLKELKDLYPEKYKEYEEKVKLIEKDNEKYWHRGNPAPIAIALADKALSNKTKQKKAKL